LCLKMLVSDYQLVLRHIADEQNAYKCGWMEISDIIPFLHSCVFILCYFIDYFGYVGLCEYVCLFAQTCIRACMHVCVCI
jgi:hypothetical protein